MDKLPWAEEEPSVHEPIFGLHSQILRWNLDGQKYSSGHILISNSGNNLGVSKKKSVSNDVSMSIYTGDSGLPVIDSAQKLIGVVSRTFDDKTKRVETKIVSLQAIRSFLDEEINT